MVIYPMEIPGVRFEDIANREREELVQTSWWVITGGPRAGKTTLIEVLNSLGHRTVPEAARAIIDEGIAEGKTIDEIRGDRVAFQSVVFARKEATEEALPPDALTFLDRGSLGDTLAYLSLALGQEVPDFSIDFPGKETIIRPPKRTYQGVFLLDLLPYEQDYARTEDAETARLIHRLLGDMYQSLGYEPVIVPVMPVEDRLSFILEHVGMTT